MTGKTKFSVAEAVDAYIASVTEAREPDGKWHPSSMFGCVRQAIYHVRGTPITEDTDKITKRRFYIGHRLHEAVQRALEGAAGVEECYSEFEIDVESANVVGHGDTLVKLKDGRWILVEVKSIKKMGMKFGLPKPDHVSQVKVYAWAARNHGFYHIDVDLEDRMEERIHHPPLGKALVGIVLVYMEKEDLKIVEVPFDWDDSWNGEIAERLVDLEMYRADPMSLPPRLPYVGGKKDWHCNYCPFKTKCYTGDPVEIAPRGGF